MDTATVKKTLLANKNVTKLYSILCGALLKAQDRVSVYLLDETHKQVRLDIHRWNQHMAPDRKTSAVLSFPGDPCLEGGGFIIRTPSHASQDGFAYKVRIKRGRKLPYLDLEPVSPRHSSRSMEMGIHDWFERVLGDYLRPVRRCLRMKEEIMMRAWHPDRVLRLLELGIDVEDM